MSDKNKKSIIIIGAGFAGLAAGTYARMNGYKTQNGEWQEMKKPATALPLSGQIN